MKYIVFITMIAFFSSIAMDQELVMQVEEQSGKRPAEQELDGAAKRARAQKVQTLYACSLKASLALLKESGEKVIDFIEQITVNACPAYPCAQLIELYLKDLESKALADSTGPSGAQLNQERMELAAYCVTKSIALYIKSDKTGPIPHPFVKDEQRVEGPKKAPTKVCPFGELALRLLRDLGDDKFYEDRAVIQPLPLLYMTKATRIIHVDSARTMQLQEGYEKLREFLLEHGDPDRVIHALRQLIVHDEQAALHALELLKNKRCCDLKGFAEHLFRWADLFNRPRVVAWLLDWHKHVYNDQPALVNRWYDRDCPCESKEKGAHLISHLERAAYLGDVKALEGLSSEELGIWKIPHLEDKLDCSRLITVAARMGYTELVQWCLQKGLGVGQGDVQEAADYGHLGALRLLVSHFKDPITKDYNWMDYCRVVDYGYLEAIKCIVGKLDSSAFDRLLRTALIVNNTTAAMNRTIVGFLLDNAHQVRGKETTKAKIIREQFCRAITLRSSKDMLDQFIQRSIAMSGFSSIDEASNPLRCAATALINWLGDIKGDYLRCCKENIEFLLDKGARDEADSKGVTTVSYLKHWKTLLGDVAKAAKEEKESDLNEKIALLDAIIKRITNAREVTPARKEKYSEGLIHFPKPPSDI